MRVVVQVEEGKEDGEPKLRERLRIVADQDFARISYTEAVELVSKVAGPRDGVAWEFPPKWGEELQTEHEKYLAETVFKKPVIVYNYPKVRSAQPKTHDPCAPIPPHHPRTGR